MIFLESPWPILFLGIVMEAILAIMLMRSGRGVLLSAMAGVGVVVLLGLLLERSVVTDAKRVHQTLEEVCAGLEANDFKRVSAQITPNADGNDTRAEAQLVLTTAQIKEMSLRGVETEFNYNTPQPTAKVTFFVMARGHLRQGDMAMADLTRPGKLQVTLRKEGEKWLIVSHKILVDPRE